MLGAIIGDIVGSRFEFKNYRHKDFELFTTESFCTDDTVMTLAVAMAFLASGPAYKDLHEQAIYYMQKLGRKYPDAGYGRRFSQWLSAENPLPYDSYGNGAAMRISSCAYFANSLDQVKSFSKAVTEISHNHPEGLKGAEATAVSTYLALKGADKEKLKAMINQNYYQLNDLTLDQIRENYEYNLSCQASVPQALVAFFESHDFEDAIRNAISIGGDSDTIAAITGSVAEAYYGVPEDIKAEALTYLDSYQLAIYRKFCER